MQYRKRIAVTAISGMGGIGKTELALQYAISQFEQKQYPGGFCWLRARDQEIATQIVTFAQTKLGLTLPGGLDAQGQVAYCWGQWTVGEVLIVLDDVNHFDAVAPYLPPSDSRFKVLITTRLNLGVQSLTIEELDEESALALLETFIGSDRIQSQLKEAQALCNWVGNQPLGLELLGRFLARKLDWSLNKLIKHLEVKKIKAQALIAAESEMTAQLGVAAALELSWVELNKAEQELACLLGIFATAPIPWSLVEECLSERDKDELENLRDEGLLDRNLIKRVGEGNYQLHQIVQEFFRVKLHEWSDEGLSLKSAFCKLMVSIARGIDENPTVDLIAEVGARVPHIEEMMNQWVNCLSDNDLIWPFIGVGRFYAGQGNYSLALPWYQKCLEKTRQRFGNEHPYVGTSLHNLASLYEQQRQYKQAETLYLNALEIYDHNHPDFATSLNNLAEVYRNQGRYEQAAPLYIQSLRRRQKLYGSEHPHIASSLNNLALLYTNQGHYREARSLFEQALKMLQKLYGSEHPHIASNLFNLAVLHDFQEQNEEAARLHEQALHMRQKLLGAEHLIVGNSMWFLGALYQKLGRNKEAESLYRKALAIFKEQLGTDHPHTQSLQTSLVSLQ